MNEPPAKRKRLRLNDCKYEPNAAVGPVSGESDEVNAVEAWDCQGPAHNRGDQVPTSRLGVGVVAKP